MSPSGAARAADIFTALVVASVGIALAGLTWDLVAAGSAPVAAPAPPPALPRGEVDVRPIVALAPFGAGAAQGPLAPTSLPLMLRGVIVVSPAAASTAFIAANGGAPTSYAIGASVPGGATLAEVGVDHVVLDVGGRREMLAFPQPKVAPPPGGPPPSPDGGPLANAPASASPIASAMGGAVSPGAPGGPPGASLLDGLGATPVPGGYRVGEGMSPNFRQAGLQPGDVVEAINGAPLGNPAADQQVLQNALRSGSVSLAVQRGGRRVTLSFPLR